MDRGVAPPGQPGFCPLTASGRTSTLPWRCGLRDLRSLWFAPAPHSPEPSNAKSRFRCAAGFLDDLPLTPLIPYIFWLFMFLLAYTA